MVDVDLRYFWGHGFVVSSEWFVPSGLLTRYFVLRYGTQSSPWSSLAADVAMGAASWLFVSSCPIASALISWHA
jgi:hypothetical protein